MQLVPVGVGLFSPKVLVAIKGYSNEIVSRGLA